jgi:pyruvate/2-oxoglutarate dehydrogenase complex dihydrolipoamide acyltransferase (E2) component
MHKVPIIMPQLGESIAEATVVQIMVKPGDSVAADQDVIEVETNKAVMSVTTPCPGTVAEITADLQESYPVGATLGFILIEEGAAARLGVSLTAPDTEIEKADEPARPGAALAKGPEPVDPGKPTKRAARKFKVEPTLRGLPVPAIAAGASYMSPRLKARMTELGLHAADLSAIAGSGAGSRVTIEDLELFLSKIDNNKTSPASTMRVAVADAMRRSWTRPIAMVAMPADLTLLLNHRKTLSPRPGPALYALRALGIALGENRAPAGRLIGTRIIHPPAIDIGFAVEAEDGVLVPVLRDVDQSPLAEITPRYLDLVNLARDRRLPPSATGGSIATVTNFGTFELTWATPIPLPEQTLVLGIGVARTVPKWDEKSGAFLPASEANLTLSFDHRVLDGGAAGRLLQRVVSLLGTPEKL